MINSLIFDFGGTIDTDGIHWIEKFWSVYKKNSVKITRDQFIDAYIFAERKMTGRVKTEDPFKITLYNQVSLQFEFLITNRITDPSENKTDSIVDICYADSKKSVMQFKGIIEKLEKNYSLAVVSNFYGNLKAVLKGFDIHHLFNTVVDSALENTRKPDPEIFNLVLKRLKHRADEAVVIGDSYKNDIEPAFKIGCRTIWLKNKSYIEEKGNINFDFKISSINQLPQIINKEIILYT